MVAAATVRMPKRKKTFGEQEPEVQLRLTCKAVNHHPQLLNLWDLIGFTEVLFSKVKVIWGWGKVVTPLNHIVRNFFPFQFSYTPHYV